MRQHTRGGVFPAIFRPEEREARGLQIKRLAFLDILKRESDMEVEDENEQFDSDFVLMTGELSLLLADLVEALNGEKANQPQKSGASTQRPQRNTGVSAVERDPASLLVHLDLRLRHHPGPACPIRADARGQFLGTGCAGGETRFLEPVANFGQIQLLQ